MTKLCKKCSKETYANSTLCYDHLFLKKKEQQEAYNKKAIAKMKLKAKEPKKPKKKKEPTELQKVEKLRKKCVALAKQINKELNKYKCEYCGIGKPQRMVHSHHIFSEGLNKSMSSDVDNLICLCWLHHLGGLHSVSANMFSFHGHPADAMAWFQEKFPEKYQILLQRSKQIKKTDRIFWENKMVELKDLINKYEKL